MIRPKNHGDWEIAFYEKNQGYLCPVWTDEGLLVAFQIRLDNPFQKRKYVWLSSAMIVTESIIGKAS